MGPDLRRRGRRAGGRRRRGHHRPAAPALPSWGVSMTQVSDAGTHAGPGSAAVSVHGVGRVFSGRKGNDVIALYDVHLDVAEGESVSLIGRSGCGKSTLLRSAADLDRPSSGSLTVFGKPA